MSSSLSLHPFLAGLRMLSCVIANHERRRRDLMRCWRGGPAAHVRQALQNRRIDPTLIGLALEYATVLRFGQHPKIDRRSLPGIEERDAALAEVARCLEVALAKIVAISTLPTQPPSLPTITYRSPVLDATRLAIEAALSELKLTRRPALPWFAASPGALFSWLTAESGLGLSIDEVVAVLKAHQDHLDDLRKRRSAQAETLGDLRQWVWQQRERFEERERQRLGLRRFSNRR